MCLGIDVSVEVKNGDLLLCYECKYLRFIWAAKAAKNRRWMVVMVPGIGWHFRRLRVVEEIRSHLFNRNLAGLVAKITPPANQLNVINRISINPIMVAQPSKILSPATPTVSCTRTSRFAGVVDSA